MSRKRRNASVLSKPARNATRAGYLLLELAAKREETWRAAPKSRSATTARALGLAAPQAEGPLLLLLELAVKREETWRAAPKSRSASTARALGLAAPQPTLKMSSASPLKILRLIWSSQDHVINSCQLVNHCTCIMVLGGLFIFRPGPRVVQKIRSPYGQLRFCLYFYMFVLFKYDQQNFTKLYLYQVPGNRTDKLKK